MDAKGNLVHGTNIKAQRLLEDETVEKIFGYGSHCVNKLQGSDVTLKTIWTALWIC